MSKRYLLSLLSIVTVLALGLGVFVARSSPSPIGAPVATPSPSPRPGATLAIAPSPVKQGGSARIDGQNFAPGETVTITAEMASPGSANHPGRPTPGAMISLGRVQAAQNGTIHSEISTLPAALTSGHYQLVVVGQKSGERATMPLGVRAKALWITPSSYAVKQTGSLGLVLGGFAPDEPVAVSLAPAAQRPDGTSQDPTKLSKPTPLTTVQTDDVGNATWSQVSIPTVVPGAYNLVAKGTKSGQSMAIDIVVNALTPVVQLSPWSGPPGSKVQINARGFAPKATVQIFLGNAQQPLTSATTDQYGDFWGVGPLQVPYNSNPGPLEVRLVDSSASNQVTATFNVQNIKPWLELSAYSGPPGSPVQFSGGGWAAGETVKIHLGDASGPIIAVGQADDYGWLRPGSSTAVPDNSTNQASTTGVATSSVTYTAIGDQSRATASASFKTVSLVPVPVQP